MNSEFSYRKGLFKDELNKYMKLINSFQRCVKDKSLNRKQLMRKTFSFLLTRFLPTKKMAVLSLVDTQKNDLKFLHGQPAQISADFCKLAWSFLCKGTNLKTYQTASQKLHVDVKQIQSVVEGLANLFVEAGKNELNEEEFKEAVKDLGFSEDACNMIYTEYCNQKHVLDVSLPQAGMQHLQFKNLEWRFETQVTSRCIKNKIQPRVLIKLELEKGGEKENLCLQSDIPNIIHMNQVVNQMLQSSVTQHSKRIQRAVT